jgi:hypothetical protein
MAQMSRDPALRELLEDLRHDLVKYVRLPLRMLPGDADPDAVRCALECALFRTRESPREVLSAREVYARAKPALLAAAADATRLQAFEAALWRVLAWEAALAGSHALDRAQLEADLAGLSGTLEAWLQEVSRG